MIKALIILLFNFSWFYLSCQNPTKKVPHNVKVELTRMFLKDQELRALLEEKSFSESQRDSIWKIQNEIDYNNTKRLIELTNLYGFISTDNYQNIEVPVYYIFVHSPLEFKEEIQKIINQEKSYERISKSEYGIINWHINGRQDIQIKY